MTLGEQRSQSRLAAGWPRGYTLPFSQGGAAMTAALSLQDVSLRYGRATALDGVSFSIARGEIVGLLGPNGSGKSTALAVAAGLLQPASGVVLLDGVARSVEPLRFARSIGFVPQDSSLYDELTAAQNLEFFGSLYGLQGGELDRRVARGLARANLYDRADDRVRRFSGGMKQRLGIACALLHDPAVVLLDEPTASLDAASRDSLLLDLQRLRDEGHAVLLTTHQNEEAAGFDRVVLLEAGRVVASGQPQDLTLRKQSLMYGHLREAMPMVVSRGLQERLTVNGVELEVIGRRVRLAALNNDELGRALSLLLAEGASLETFRTPPTAWRRAA